MTKANLDLLTPHYVTYATEHHGDQKYGDKPYKHHLQTVEDILAEYGFMAYKWKAAAWLHDVVEDTKITLADIINEFGVEIAELVISVSGQGANRKEKQLNILHKLQYCPDACILKCADRIANVESSKVNKPELFELYKSEQKAFENVVKKHVPETMWERLEEALK